MFKRIYLLKKKDLDAFTIPSVIGNVSFKRALCDLGASINVMNKMYMILLVLSLCLKLLL